MTDNSEQEIDLRPYVEAIIDKWYWIFGLGLLAGILAYVVTSLITTPTYEATALVSIVEPRQWVQFDPRIVSNDSNQPLKAYPEIAISDELLTTLQTEVPEAGAFRLPQLQSMLKAIPGRDPSLLKLSASNENPETAAALANGWAALFVSWANKTFGDSNEEQLVFFKQRLEDAAVELQEAEDALIEFQAENRSLILENELLALQQNHADLLAKEGEINLLVQDIESLLARSQENSTGSTATASDQFTALILRLRAFGGPPNESESTSPWQLQVSSDSLSSNDGGDLEGQLRNLQASLWIQAEQINTALAEIEPQILAVQKEKQEANAMEALLARNVEVAQDTHTVLAQTVEEKRITSQDTSTGINLVSRSAVPTSPTGQPKSRNALAAAVSVMLLGVLVIILITWWREDDEQPQLDGESISD